MKKKETHKKLENVRLMELNEAYQKVLYWFFSFPDTSIGLNELSATIQISKTTAKKIINDLEKDAFIDKKIYGNTWIITCNQTHKFNRTKKIVFNLNMVFDMYERGLREDILDLVGNAKAIVLFGSYRKGDDNDKSDIDIAVEIAGDADLRIIHLGKISEFGYRRNVPVNIHIFSRNKIDINLFSNIANGIVLEGFLEVRT